MTQTRPDAAAAPERQRDKERTRGDDQHEQAAGDRAAQRLANVASASSIQARLMSLPRWPE